MWLLWLSDTIRCSRIILCISCPRPRISSLPQNLGSFYWRTVLETSDLGVKFAHCYVGCCCFYVAVSADKAEKYMCVYCPVFISTNISLCNHIYIYIHQTKRVHVLTQPSLLPLLICKFPLKHWQTWPVISYLFSCLIPLYMYSSTIIVNSYSHWK